jgi:hypothetical protein
MLVTSEPTTEVAFHDDAMLVDRSAAMVHRDDIAASGDAVAFAAAMFTLAATPGAGVGTIAALV